MQHSAKREWEKSMQEEMGSLHQNQTWDLVNFLVGKWASLFGIEFGDNIEFDDHDHQQCQLPHQSAILNNNNNSELFSDTDCSANNPLCQQPLFLNVWLNESRSDLHQQRTHSRLVQHQQPGERSRR